MYDICCIGHLTLDKVVTPKKVMNMAGGTSFYFSNAIRNMDLRYILVTSLAKSEERFVSDLRAKDVEVNVIYGSNTVYFENIYSGNLDHRVQKVLQTADAFSFEQIKHIDASIFHLGPLLAGDIPLDLLKALSLKGKVSLDVQGYLRQVENQNVFAIDWKNKKEGLRYVDILKANEYEMEVLTGTDDVRKSARMLSDWGVKEVVITLGSRGSVIYTDNTFYDIPAFVPAAIIDTTGCGDTYMAGYLYQRIRLAAPQDAGEFGAAMASLKIESHGPFMGTETKVLSLLSNNRK
ncbi:MAG: PfkB family carbohydrate kinase [Bacteroidota bacterium]